MSLPRTLGELQLYRVLQRANLLAYYETFIQQGGDDVQQLCEAGEEEFLEIMALVGMATKPLHVRRLQKALRDWAANPALFSQPVANVPLGGIPLFKVEGTGSSGSAGGPRKALSNGQPGSPSDREDRSCLLIINEAAAQFCIRDNALLLRRMELFSLAPQVARKCAYTSTLKNARSNTDDSSGLSLKRARHEVIVSESSLLGVEGSEGATQRADEDSLSAESVDCVSHDSSSQCNQSPSPRPHGDASNPASWSRHLIQQTLMDEGLRLAGMVSHDQAGKLSLGPEGTHTAGCLDKCFPGGPDNI